MNMKNSGSKAYNFGLIGALIAFVGLLIVLIVFLVKRSQEKKKLQPLQPSNRIDEAEAKPDNSQQKAIFDQIVSLAMEYGFSEQTAIAIAGVSAHETGRWGSELAIKYNNIFGMKDGGAGLAIQTGTKSGYATYASWEDSLKDYVELLKAKGYPITENLTVEQHVQWMKSKKYFEDTLANYKNSVLSLSNELNT